MNSQSEEATVCLYLCVVLTLRNAIPHIENNDKQAGLLHLAAEKSHIRKDGDQGNPSFYGRTTFSF